MVDLQKYSKPELTLKVNLVVYKSLKEIVFTLDTFLNRLWTLWFTDEYLLIKVIFQAMAFNDSFTVNESVGCLKDCIWDYKTRSVFKSFFKLGDNVDAQVHCL